MKRAVVFFSLFLLTVFTTSLAGVQWLNLDPLELSNLPAGLLYSFLIMTFLTAHEFGHYLAAKHHRVGATLPFYIPAPPFLVNPFGTLGALIRMRSVPYRSSSLFDIGVSGPIAGFIVSVIFLIIGFLTLPGIEYLYTIHPEYAKMATIPTNGLHFGNSILYLALEKLVPSAAFIPPMNEIYHYPLLCAGWFGLFVTALNLMPIGQLDGGHVIYAMFGGRLHRKIARIFFILLITVGVVSIIPAITSDIYTASIGWLIWAAILYFFVKLDHPEVAVPEPLSQKRMATGIFSIVIFFISFPPIPFLDLP